MAGGQRDGRDAARLWGAKDALRSIIGGCPPSPCCPTWPAQMPNVASSALLLRLFHKLPWRWQSRAHPGREAVPGAGTAGGA